MHLCGRCSAFVWALLRSRCKAKQGITSACVLGGEWPCGITRCVLDGPSSMNGTTAGASYCFRNGQDAASSIPFAPCLMARKYFQEENRCDLGLRGFVHLFPRPRREPNYFLRWANSYPFFKPHCCAGWCRKTCHHTDCKCPRQWRSQPRISRICRISQDLEKLEMKRRITLLGSITRGRAWIRSWDVYVGRFCHSQLVFQLLNYTAEVSRCKMSPTWHHHCEISTFACVSHLLGHWGSLSPSWFSKADRTVWWYFLPPPIKLTEA